VARVLAGPRFSPIAHFATRVAAPRLGPERPTPGPPKRFAQGIGASVTLAGTAAWLAGATAVADGALAVMVVAATLESAFAFCLGCKVFGVLMRTGLIPEAVCLECADITARRA
jgi:hypothetical protein